MIEPSTLDNLKDYWTHDATTLLSALESTPQGISDSEAQERLVTFGLNGLDTHRKSTPVKLFLNQFKDPITLILLFATVVSAATSEWVDAVIILLIILGSATLSFFQEYNAGNAVEKLREKISLKSSVIRDGITKTIPAVEVVPGDILLLSAGSLVPADGIITEALDCYVNEATLTGETFPVKKEPGIIPREASLAGRTNCVFMGTNVRSGSARILIVQTGSSTVFGQVAEHLKLKPPETEFERGIHRLGYMLTRVMLVLVIIVFAINVFFHKPILDSLLFSIALAVGLTPQLLPAITSITLSKGSQQMAKSGVIVRRLASIENFGSMDVLCTDKTGTITIGVAKLDGALDAAGNESDEVFKYAYLNSCYETGLSSPLDEAILAAGEPNLDDYTKITEIPYDFVRKRLTVVVTDQQNGALLVTKGALDKVLEISSTILEAGQVVPLNDAQRLRIHQNYELWSSQGFRVLGVAIRRDKLEVPAYTWQDEHDFNFVGYLLFLDPPKEGITEIIADLAQQGINLKIITGDNRLVTSHIAESIQLPVTGMLTGAEIMDMADEALWYNVERTNLFVEVDPNQKERIILALKKLGHVVGYMGDGINDAPALHNADVGISVDTGVDVAKEAADFILLKQDLSVLNQGILLGRTTFANTLKYILTTISANFGNMFSMAGASLFLPFLPMLPLQILLTNFLTDFPSINIADDSIDPGLIERPRRWDEHFIRRFMITFGLASSVFDYLTFFVLILIFKTTEQQFHTGWFLESIITELLIVFIVRTQKRFYQSKPGRMLLITTLVVLAITLILPYSPLNNILGLTPLPIPIILALAGITILYLLSTEILKFIFYHRENLRDSAS